MTKPSSWEIAIERVKSRQAYKRSAHHPVRKRLSGSSLGTKISEPRIVALVAMLIYTLISVSVLAGHAWDPLAFVLERPAETPSDQTWAIGYDGQHAFAIARDPLNPPGWIDHTAFRYMRIVYPILAGILALEIDALIPWTMLLINLAATGIATYVLAIMLRERGAPGWPALIFIASFNYLIGVRFDLNEPLAFALVLLGLYWYRRKQMHPALVALALAGLTKEIALAFPIGLALYELGSRNRKTALMIGVATLAPYLLWAQIVTAWQAESPFYRGLAPASLIPFAGFFEVGLPESRIIILLWAVAPALAAAAYGAWKLLRSKLKTSSAVPYLVLVNAGVLGTIPVLTWVDPLAVLRTGLGALLSMLLLTAEIDHARRIYFFLAALWLPSMLLALLIPGFVL